MPETVSSREVQESFLSLTNRLQTKLIERRAARQGVSSEQAAADWIKDYSKKFRTTIENKENVSIIDLARSGDEELALEMLEKIIY